MELNATINQVFRMKGKYEQTFFKSFFNVFNSPDGLTHNHILSMIILDLDGPSRMSYISEKLSLEKGSFTPVACRLIELGYVEKVRDEKDKRVYILTLTEKGRNFSQKFRTEHYEFVEMMLQQLSEADQTIFIHAISEISRIIDSLDV